MLVACSTLCYSSFTLPQAMQRMRELQFSHLDFAIHDGGPHIRPEEVAQDPLKVAAKLRAESLPVAAFHFVPAGLESETARKQLLGMSRLARNLSVPLITTLAGIDLDTETARLQDWVELTKRDGIFLTVETHAGTVTRDPEAAVELCRRVPGLYLTLDPSHYLCGHTTPLNYDTIFKFVKHVRLRDTGLRPSEFQVRIGQGAVEVAKILSGLEKYHYNRTLTVDVRDISDAPFPVEPEVRKLKYLIESLI